MVVKRKQAIRVFYVLILVISAALIGLQVRQLTRRQATDRFQADSTTIASAVATRLDAQLNILYGIRAATTLQEPFADPNIWDDFVQSQFLFERYPGLQAVGYSIYVTNDQLPSLLSDINRQSDSPNPLQLRPPNNNPEHIVLIAETRRFGDKTSQLGFDALVNSARKSAIEQSRQRGLPAMTAPVAMRDNGDQGVIVYLPVYYGLVAPESDVQSIRPAAFVSVTIDTEQLIAAAIGEPGPGGIAAIVTDPTTNATLYQSSETIPDGMEQTTTITAGGRTWLVKTYADNDYSLYIGERLAPVIISFSVIAASVAFMRGWQRRRIRKLPK